MKAHFASLKLGLGLLIAASAVHAAPVRGTYVEARTANVFVGACHFGSEYQTLGRNAILTWHIASGERDGLSLAGLNVVAVVSGENNLAESGSVRSSIIYTDNRASKEQAAALVNMAKELSGSSLGKVLSTRPAAVTYVAAGDDFQVKLPGAVVVNASRLADRACCVMPYRVWYKPLAAVQHPIVGAAKQNSYSGTGLNASWSYPGQNSAFIGEFGAR